MPEEKAATGIKGCEIAEVASTAGRATHKRCGRCGEDIRTSKHAIFQVVHIAEKARSIADNPIKCAGHVHWSSNKSPEMRGHLPAMHRTSKQIALIRYTSRSFRY
jgi:hypothetical protein